MYFVEINYDRNVQRNLGRIAYNRRDRIAFAPQVVPGRVGPRHHAETAAPTRTGSRSIICHTPHPYHRRRIPDVAANRGSHDRSLCRKHSIYEWSAQSKADPIPVARAQGIHFWTPEGKRFIDFNSQLMCSNIGHAHPKVVKAIQEQAATLAYANPFMATEPRARLGAKLAEIAPGDIDTYEGGQNIAAFVMETVVGTNGILIPPDGYMQGVREICDHHGILLVCDEVMCFGRTGRWFAVDHWGVVPDLMTMAKGITSAYVQLGAVGMRPQIARAFQDRAFPGALTYNSHTLACATALATIAEYEEEGLLENAQRMGRLMRQRHLEMERRHASVGTTRSIGLFGIFELVRNRAAFEPLAPYNGTSEEMAALGRFFREQGLYTFVRWNTFFTNPPLIINEEQLDEAFTIIDRGLEITDRAAAG